MSAKLVPPVLIVLLGAAFLAYRAGARDWRGVSALDGGSWSWSWPRLRKPAPTPAKPGPSLALKAAPTPPPADTPEATEAPSGGKAEAPADPLDDIRREAEATRERMAELEALKEKEKEKLDATADQRRQEDRLDRRARPRLRGVPAEQIERMMAAQNEMMQRHMAMMAELQQRQMRHMAEQQRRFFNRPFPHPAPGFGPGGAPGDLGAPPFGLAPPPGGVTRFRRFRGPGGAVGFEMRWESGPADDH